MALDLSAGRSLSESLMVDRCSIYRDPQGALDDTLNPTTLELSSPAGDVTTVATDVPCIVSQRNTRNQGDEEGERLTYRRTWQVRVPLSTAATKAGDVIEITSTNRTELVGHRVKVFDVTLNSYATTRKMLAEDETGTLRR